jgi:hypothetical protein
VKQFILRVDDVGRVNGDLPECGSDHSLTHFFEWVHKTGLEGLPAVYGLVPEWVNAHGLYCFLSLPHYCRAVHGWDHVRGKAVTLREMGIARTKLQADIYIPPFNAYQISDVINWAECGGRTFLGGFYCQHHHLGDQPININGVKHYSANDLLYDRSAELIKQIEKNRTYDCVQVITLHVPWEVDTDATKKLVSLIKDHLIALEK